MSDEEKDLKIAELEWKLRYCLNRMKTNRRAYVGNYGLVEPFDVEIYEEVEKNKLEKKLRDQYIELGGKVIDWFIFELYAYLAPYGYFINKDKHGNYLIIKLTIEESKEIALIDPKGPNGKFYLCCSTKPIDDKILAFDETSFVKIREYIFEWDRV